MTLIASHNQLTNGHACSYGKNTCNEMTGFCRTTVNQTALMSSAMMRDLCSS